MDFGRSISIRIPARNSDYSLPHSTPIIINYAQIILMTPVPMLTCMKSYLQQRIHEAYVFFNNKFLLAFSWHSDVIMYLFIVSIIAYLLIKKLRVWR
jgi:hypothetical protein